MSSNCKWYTRRVSFLSLTKLFKVWTTSQNERVLNSILRSSNCVLLRIYRTYHHSLGYKMLFACEISHFKIHWLFARRVSSHFIIRPADSTYLNYFNIQFRFRKEKPPLKLPQKKLQRQLQQLPHQSANQNLIVLRPDALSAPIPISSLPSQRDKSLSSKRCISLSKYLSH